MSFLLLALLLPLAGGFAALGTGRRAGLAAAFGAGGAVLGSLCGLAAALRGLPEIARRIELLDAVILERAAEDKSIAVFPIRGGLLAEPVFLRFGELSSQPRSVEAILRHELEPEAGVGQMESRRKPDSGGEPAQDREPSSTDWRARYGLRAAPAELAEHLALVARWFYSKPREGEIFFRDGGWPYRRILRACGRLLQPSAAGARSGDTPSPRA